MNEQHEDPILDACLDEVLGEVRPPDLRDRILESLETGSESVEPVDVNQVVVRAPAKIRSRPKSRTKRPWVEFTVAAAVLLAGVGFGLWALNWTSSNEVAPGGDVVVRQELQDTNSEFAPATSEAPRMRPSGTNDALVDRLPLDGFGGAEVEDEPPSAVVDAQQADLSTEQIVSLIDSSIRSKWGEVGIEPAGESSETAWCQNVYLTLLGREPQPSELEGFVADETEDKRQQLLDRLLNGADYQDEFALHWSQVWTDVLLGPERTGSSEANREALGEYLAAGFRDGLPFDEIASGLIDAEGTVANSDGAAAFLLAHWDEGGVRATAEVSRVFLGEHAACVRCHDHPANGQIAQSRFWELNSFLRQTTVGAADGDEPALLKRDFLGDTGQDVEMAAVEYQAADGQQKQAFPVLPGGTELSRSGRLADVDRRKELAGTLVKSAAFERAIVNQYWKSVFGYGLQSAFHSGPTRANNLHDDLASELGRQFAANQFSPRALLGWVLLSEPFSLARSDYSEGWLDRPEMGGSPYFSRRYAKSYRRQSPESSLLSLVEAVDQSHTLLGQRATTANLAPLSRGSNQLVPRQQPQRRLDLWHERSFHEGPPRIIERIVKSDLSQEAKLEHLFLALVGRAPTEAERELASRVLEDQEGDRRAMLHVWWALMQTAEFTARR